MPPKKTTTPKKTATKKPVAKKKTIAKSASAKATTAKKSTPKKTVAQKTSPKTIQKSVTKKQHSCGTLHTLYGTLLFLLIGVIGGGIWYMMNHSTTNIDDSQKIIRYNGKTYVSIKNIDDQFRVEANKGQGLVVYQGQTWIPVTGRPVEVIVLNDKECGTSCDPTTALTALRQNITPALITRVVDITSSEGKELIQTFDVTSVPSYFLGEGASDFEVNGQKFVEGAASVLTQKDDLYYLNSNAGLPLGRFIEAPAIETKNEPQLGKGSVNVIEFTDFECPYCKRLHDQNKDLIQELIDAGTITYVMKDFPLSFHKNAMPVHAALNCTQAKAGNDAYFAMKGDIFDAQREWGQKSSADLESYLTDLAQTHGADITTCLNDESTIAEIQEDLEEGQKYGVTGTPGLFIGGQFAPGAIGPEALRSMVEAESK